MLAVYKKELRSYFNSIIGYLFIGFFLAVIGLYFVSTNLYGNNPGFEFVLGQSRFVFMVLIPVLTMRIMAEENRQRTDQLLLTSPLSLRSIVLGKYLSALSVFGVVMAVTCCYPLILTKFGTTNLKIAYACIFGFFLLGGAYIAIGLFVSTMTESQIVAAVVTFVIILVTSLMDGIAELLPKDNRTAWLIFSGIFLLLCLITYFMMHNLTVSLSLAVVGEAILTALYILKPTLYDGAVVEVFAWFSVVSRFNGFNQELFDISAVIYYISIIVVFNFLSIQSLKKRRWS